MQKYLCVFDRRSECENSTPDADGFCTQAGHCLWRNDHCKSHWFIPDTANGEAVAVLVAGIYLNSYGTCKEFVETMLHSKPAVRFNFSRLAVDWFAIQQKNIYHDKRNVDSYQFANRFCSEFQDDPPAYKRPGRKGVPELLDVVLRDGVQVAGVMDAYLRRGFGDGYRDFLQRLQYEHPTLQQRYTRMCCEWFTRLADAPDLPRGAERKWAKKIQTWEPPSGLFERSAVMKITDVIIRRLYAEGRMKALVSIVLDGDFAVHDLKVIEGLNRTFVAMPYRETEPGKFVDIAHPITSEARKKLEDAVLAAYYAAAAKKEE